MPDLTKEEFVNRLHMLDRETLYFLIRYAKAKRERKYRTLITAFIVAVGGLSLSISYLLPEFSILAVSVISALLGGLVAALSTWERRLTEVNLMSRLLRDAERQAEEHESEDKKRLVEEFLKAEGIE